MRRPFGPAVTGSFAIAVTLLIVLSGILVYDGVILPAIAVGECRLRGRAAEVRGVPDGTPIDPDSGGCSAYGCADEVFDVDRVLLGDYERIERHRTSC